MIMEISWDPALEIKAEVMHTIDEIEALPDGQRAEIIDGMWYDMATPSTTHQRLVGLIYRKISDHIEKKGGKCETFIAPFAVYICNDEHNYVEPDVSVICDPEKIDEKGCHGAPDLTVEVVSPTSRTVDYIRKLDKYASTGVREYWIVDPETRVTSMYIFDNDRGDGSFDLKQYGFDEELRSGIYPDLTIKLTDVI
jgi:Uma2 family endonuclease